MWFDVIIFLHKSNFFSLLFFVVVVGVAAALPEFDRSCTLRRSLSDRVALPMANPARFHDTTKLTQKSRSRGSLHNLLRMTAGMRHSSGSSSSSSAAGDGTPTGTTPGGRFPLSGRIKRPKIPPPPPPLFSSGFRMPDETPLSLSPSSSPSPSPSLAAPTGPRVAPTPVATPLTTPVAPPVAPPRRIFRFSRADLDTLSQCLLHPPRSADSSPEALGSSSAVTSWACRPLSGQVKYNQALCKWAQLISTVSYACAYVCLCVCVCDSILHANMLISTCIKPPCVSVTQVWPESRGALDVATSSLRLPRK